MIGDSCQSVLAAKREILALCGVEAHVAPGILGRVVSWGGDTSNAKSVGASK